MPANLTPQYYKAEDEYRRAQTAQEQVDCLQVMLKIMPKHKGTDKLQADIKHRLKEAREAAQVEKSAPKKRRPNVSVSKAGGRAGGDFGWTERRKKPIGG